MDVISFYQKLDVLFTLIVQQDVVFILWFWIGMDGVQLIWILGNEIDLL
jgi:hypothetical protein